VFDKQRIVDNLWKRAIQEIKEEKEKMNIHMPITEKAVELCQEWSQRSYRTSCGTERFSVLDRSIPFYIDLWLGADDGMKEVNLFLEEAIDEDEEFKLGYQAFEGFNQVFQLSYRFNGRTAFYLRFLFSQSESCGYEETGKMVEPEPYKEKKWRCSDGKST